MQNSSKTTGIVILVLIILVGVFLMTRKSSISMPEQESQPAASSTQDTANSADAGVSSIQASGTTDAALDQDTAAIDSQIDAFSSDSTAAQSGN